MKVIRAKAAIIDVSEDGYMEIALFFGNEDRKRAKLIDSIVASSRCAGGQINKRASLEPFTLHFHPDTTSDETASPSHHSSLAHDSHRAETAVYPRSN
jgi:hypothetical protein